MNPAKRGLGRNGERRKAKRKARHEAAEKRKADIAYVRATFAPIPNGAKGISKYLKLAEI